LNARLRAGEVTLESKGPSGYLESLLKVLHVPVESQVLVFSKTSFQAPRINPRNPRAIFFNDTVSVGWVRGGPVLEVMVQDAKQGAIFYTLEQAQSGGTRRRSSSAMTPAPPATPRTPRRTCPGRSLAVSSLVSMASRCTGRPTRPTIEVRSSCAGAAGT
jgi:hypothetical protein